MKESSIIKFYEKLKEFVNEGNIYKDVVIKIKFFKKSKEGEYIINTIECEGVFDDKLKNKISLLKQEINDRVSSGGRYNIFYLLKEIITYLQGNERNEGYEPRYNYYRGQGRNWKTIPSLLRDMSDKDGKRYYEEFEGIYQKISREFPEDIKYYDLSEDLRNKRFEQLSRLQHYELKTNLLDITENPFIAMLFMTQGDKLDRPQLELYNIEKETKFFQDGTKISSNKRIKAQKGAFINYEKIVECYKEDKFEIDDEDRINRIILSIELDIDKTEEVWNSVASAIQKEGEDNFQSKYSDNVSGDVEKLNLYRDSIKSNRQLNEDVLNFIFLMYKDIRLDIKDKLGEYGYFYEELFPDLADYIRNISKKYN